MMKAYSILLSFEAIAVGRLVTMVPVNLQGIITFRLDVFFKNRVYLEIMCRIFMEI